MKNTALYKIYVKETDKYICFIPDFDETIELDKSDDKIPYLVVSLNKIISDKIKNCILQNKAFQKTYDYEKSSDEIELLIGIDLKTIYNDTKTIFDLLEQDKKINHEYIHCEDNVLEFLKHEKVMTITFSSSKWKNKIRSLKEKDPDNIIILYDDKNSITAKMPISYLHLSNSKKNISPERKQFLRERLSKIRKNK